MRDKNQLDSENVTRMLLKFGLVSYLSTRGNGKPPGTVMAANVELTIAIKDL